MKAVYKAQGCSVHYTPGTAITGGDVVVVNGFVRVAKSDIAAGEKGSLATCGLFNWVKDASNISDGNAVYWDADGNPVGGTAGSGALTTTAAGNTFVGYAQQDAGVDVGTVLALLIHVPAALVTNSETERAIADPGDAGAIPVAAGGHVDLVTAKAETRTLAAPTLAGQQLLISLKTDGGDCTVTCATTVNQTGDNTITLGDAGDAVLLIAKTNGANLRWSVVSNDGAALSTV